MSRDYSGEIVRMSGQGGMSGELSVGVIPSHPIFHLHGEKTGWMEARHFLNQRYKTYLPCEIERTEPSPLILECLTGGHGKRVPVAKKIERDSGEMAGFLGMTLGDGYIEDRAGVPARVGLVGERDEGIMKDFANLVSVLFDRKAGYKETLTGSVSSFGHKALAEWMKNECGRYAYQKMIPPDFFRSMSEDEDRKFLHYYLDTDGTIGEDAVVFYSTSHGLAGQVYVMLLRNRIPVSVGYYTRKRGGVCGVECDRRPLFHVKVSGPARDRLLRFIGQSCEERDADSHIQAKGDWMVYPRRNAKKEHYSGRVFNLNVEGDDSYCLPSMAVHNCNQRPQWMRPVLDPGLVEESVTDEIEYTKTSPMCVGIDWGIEGEDSLCLILGIRCEGYVGIVEAMIGSGILIDRITKTLFGWYKAYGEFEVFADQSHPFENRELEGAGFPVQRVDFRKWRDFGFKNLGRFFAFRRIKILKELDTVADRLKAFRKDKYGRPIKDVNAHVADATMCMLIRFPFMEEFPDDIRVQEEDEQGWLGKDVSDDEVLFF